MTICTSIPGRLTFIYKLHCLLHEVCTLSQSYS